jgi:hypothetical protein
MHLFQQMGRRRAHYRHIPFVIILVTALHVLAINVTIDDSSGAWSYSSDVGWNGITPSTPCPGCAIQLDPTKVFNKTWHDGTCGGCSASVSFSGTSGTLYGICVSSLPPFTAPCNYLTVLILAIFHSTVVRIMSTTLHCSPFQTWITTNFPR